MLNISCVHVYVIHMFICEKKIQLYVVYGPLRMPLKPQ